MAEWSVKEDAYLLACLDNCIARKANPRQNLESMMEHGGYQRSEDAISKRLPEIFERSGMNIKRKKLVKRGTAALGEHYPELVTRIPNAQDKLKKTQEKEREGTSAEGPTGDEDMQAMDQDKTYSLGPSSESGRSPQDEREQPAASRPPPQRHPLDIPYVGFNMLNVETHLERFMGEFRGIIRTLAEEIHSLSNDVIRLEGRTLRLEEKNLGEKD
ncbi:hypothetical protein P154DRAFT_568943 [Amniculicola lignicola CBS 123094]|uniref:Uncharacterized protein n=1 Tax=Amniculicola lignicola CBS 123094 TaxID=1392246 RepID=A0A6A5X5D2_9PLEO|nr:hypothetical protein P154DRAFT_568943 [Amniculicola lignicola CBS 123094]